MDYYTNVESNCFKVRHYETFEAAIKKLQKTQKIEITELPEGNCTLWYENADLDEVIAVLEKHCVPKSPIVLREVSLSSKSTELYFALHRITECGTVSTSIDEVEAKLLKKYPKTIKCIMSSSSRETGEWVEEGKEYIAKELIIKKGRKYYLLDSTKCTESMWGKEYFSE